MAFCINLAAEEDIPDETHESGGCSFPPGVGFCFGAIGGGFVDILLLLLSLSVDFEVSWDSVPDNRFLVGSATAATGAADAVVAVTPAAIEYDDGAMDACTAAAGATKACAPCSGALIVKFKVVCMPIMAAAVGVEEE